MLWNWNTIDSCFLASSWKITSTGVFAGSCIGVVLLVISLEMLRRGVKEYDRFLISKHIKSQASRGIPKSIADEGSVGPACVANANGYRPTILEQTVRALLHTLQFAVAYFVMLYGQPNPMLFWGETLTDSVPDSPCTITGTSSSASSSAPTWAASSSTGSHLEGMSPSSRQECWQPERGGSLLTELRHRALQTSAAKEATVCCG